MGVLGRCLAAGVLAGLNWAGPEGRMGSGHYSGGAMTTAAPHTAGGTEAVNLAVPVA